VKPPSTARVLTLDDGPVGVLVRASSEQAELVVVVDPWASSGRHARSLPQGSQTTARKHAKSEPTTRRFLRRMFAQPRTMQPVSGPPAGHSRWGIPPCPGQFQIGDEEDEGLCYWASGPHAVAQGRHGYRRGDGRSGRRRIACEDRANLVPSAGGPGTSREAWEGGGSGSPCLPVFRKTRRDGVVVKGALQFRAPTGEARARPMAWALPIYLDE